MQIYTGTTILNLQVLEKGVFSSHMIGLQLRKMKLYLIIFSGLKWEIMEKSTQSTHFYPKKSIFLTGDQQYEKRNPLFFSYLQVQESPGVQIFTLRPCEIAQLEII